MAYNVTKRFREIVYSGGAVYKCSLKINNKLVPNRQIAKITISNPIIDTTSDYFYVGSYIAQKLTIQFKNLENLDIKSNNDVSLDISLDVDGTEVNVPIGKFLIDDLSENYYETCEITCLDYSVKAKNNIDYSPCFVDGKATIDTIFEYICNHFGITFDTNYPKTNGDIEVGVYDSTVSGKRYISYIAELKGCNAKHGRDGILYLVPLKQTSSVSINALKSQSWKLGEKFQISGVSYDDGARLFKAGNTTNNTLFIRNDNPFIQNQTTIDNIYNVVKDTVIWNLKTENYGDISLDPWDNISYQLGEETYNTLMNVNLTYEMNISSTNEVKLPTKQQEQTTNVVGGNIQSKLLRVGRTIDLINGTIQDLSEKIVDISTQASGHKEVELENCSETPLYKLKITGDDSLLFPGDKKKHFTYETYEGSSIDVDIKGSSYDINNLEVKGRSTQEVRSGKNLIKLEKGYTLTQNGVTFKINDDYSITLNGTCNKDNTSFSFNTSVIIPSDGAYTLSSKFVRGSISNTTNFTQIQILRSSDWAGITLKLNNEDDSKTSQISVGKYNACSIRINNNVVLSNYTIKIQLEEGSTATNWESFGASPSPDYPSEIETVKGRNICDVSTSQIGVSWILSSDSARAICNVRVMPNTTYSLSFEDISGIDGMFFGQKVKATDTSVINGMTQITANRQITTTSTTNWLCIQFNKANISLNDIEAIKLQIEKGSDITNYVPFDNIQIINTGKNLFDEDKAKKRDNYNISLSNNYKGIEISLKPNTKYSISRIVDSSLSADTGYNLQFVKEDKSTPFFYLNNSAYSQNVINGTATFITGNTGVIYLATLYGNDARLSTYFSNVKVQLEEGETVTSYEQYQSQTLNIDLQGNELCSIGDTKDILDISVTGDTTLNKKIGKRIFNGTESWTLQSINSHDIANFQITLDDYVGGSNILAMCDTFSPQTSLIADTTNEGFHINASKILFIRIKKSRCSTVEKFKTWLSTHNVTFIYELATPETINLSPTKPLYLYDGINHLTNDNSADMVAKMVKSTMFLKTSDLYVNQGQSNEKKYDLKIPALRELNGVKDEYNLENTKATLTKRIGLNANLEEYILAKPQIIDLGEITIELNEGTNILTMPSFPNNYYEVTYLLKNEYTDTFANQAQVSSMINIASDEILIKSKTEILENGDELIASINTQSTGNVLINASRLAQINANKINFNSYDFNVTTQNMKISIGQGDNKKDIINSNGVLTNLIYNGYTRGNMITGTGDYIPLGRVGGGDTKDTQRNEMIFSFKLPQNFTIQSAKIYLSHAPINWNISGTSITGYSRNLELYKGQNIEKLKINYDVVNSIINTGGVTTDKIYDVLGTNGFSGNATTTVSTKSAELKDYIDADKDNYFIIKDSNETAYTTNNDIFGRTGGVFGYLEIIGYSQV